MNPQIDIDPKLPIQIRLTYPLSKRLNPIRLIRGRKIGEALNRTPILMLEIETEDFRGECEVGNHELHFVLTTRDGDDGLVVDQEPYTVAQVTIHMPGSLRQPMYLDVGMNRYGLILVPDFVLAH